MVSKDKELKMIKEQMARFENIISFLQDEKVSREHRDRVERELKEKVKEEKIVSDVVEMAKNEGGCE